MKKLIALFSFCLIFLSCSAFAYLPQGNLPGQMVALDPVSGKLPAVDGSQLYNLSSGAMTGSIAQSQVTGLVTALSAKAVMFSSTVMKVSPILYTNNGTVSGGVVVFQLTNDGTSSGTALFPTGPLNASTNAFVSDATASYQMGYVWSNSNKTLTITTNKLSTANILTGVLGQAAANGATVNLTVWGN